MPPLLQRLSERKPEQLDYLGVSYGLTKDLLRFWKRAGYIPLYASQKENQLTGEYTFVMIRALLSNVAQAESWLGAFSQGELLTTISLTTDFRQRFMSLLSYDAFKKLDSSTALSIIDATSPKSAPIEFKPITADELNATFSPFDMKRLESYAESMIDYHVVLDLVPTLAKLYFGKRLGEDCTLSAAQQAILLALGLQRKPVEALETELGLTSSQTLALFGKVLRRLTKHLQDIQKVDLGNDLPIEQSAESSAFKPTEQTIEEDLAGDSEEIKRAKEFQRELLSSVDMSQ